MRKPRSSKTPFLLSLTILHSRISPYERGGEDDGPFGGSSSSSDEKGSRLARPEPIYDSLFSGGPQGGVGPGRLVRTIGTQAVERETSTAESVDCETFTLRNSFWFMIASLLQQGTDLLPR